MGFLEKIALTGIAFLLLGGFEESLGRIGFKKDQKTTLEFPPRLVDTIAGIPQGHLRPLGWQKQPEAMLPEVKNFPTPQEFAAKFATPRRSAIFRNVLTNVPAMKTWAKDDYLKLTYGELDVLTAVKKEVLQKGPTKTKFRKFLKEYHYEDWYLSNIAPKEMLKELLLPKPLLCGGARRALLESEIWMSSGGTTSLLHSHADHDLHCILSGRKDFILIDPKYKDNLEWRDMVIHPGAGHSTIDVDMVNMFKYPAVGDTPWRWATLLAGDCIFTPAGLIHQVRSYGRSFSSTLLWSPTPDKDFSDCNGVDLESHIPLDEVNFLWTYTFGDRHVTDSQLNADTLRSHLLVLMRNEDYLRLAIFRDFYDEVMSEIDNFPEVEEVWKFMDSVSKHRIPREEVEKMDAQVLERVASVLNRAHEGHIVKPAKNHDEL